MNLGEVDAIVERNKGKSANEIYVFKRVNQDAALCPSCKKAYLVDGTQIPKVFKLSELQANGTNYGKKSSEYLPTITPLHVNCFLDPKINVFTVKGWKKIKDIKIGDLVLTHTGKFKKVINTVDNMIKKQPYLYKKNYNGHIYRIRYAFRTIYPNGKIVSRFLRVTDDHQFLTNKGWVQAKNLTINHKLLFLYRIADCCGDRVYLSNSFEHNNKCKCIKENNWMEGNKKAKQKETYKNNLSKKMREKYLSMSIEEKRNLTALARIESQKLIKSGKHPFFNFTKEQRTEISKKNNATLKQQNRFGFQNQHIIKKAHKILAKSRITKPQLELFELVKKIFNNAILE